jgi:two-component system cell cycle sensor histidine kinase PleC
VFPAMSRRPLLTFAPDLPAPALAPLDARGHAPGWLIDVAHGRILAATAAGAAMLGLAPGATPPLLDAATPALGRLRALLAGPQARSDEQTPETLVFWTRSGPRRCMCRVHLFQADGLSLAAATAEEGAGHSAADAAGRESADKAPALFVGDDAAKLKEIARRIREGQMSAPRSERRRADAVSGGASAQPLALSAAPATEPDAIAAPLRASLAHELKTPLSAIAAAAEVMKDQRLGPIGSPRYLGYAKDIHGTAQHALSVIERMLADPAGSADASGEALDFVEIDAGGLLRDAVSELGVLAERAGLRLALEVPPRLPHLVADATSLRQIVLNLVTNAIKFTPAGGAITVAARYEGDGPLTIAVADTGVGMSADEVGLALDPGRRLIQISRAANATHRSGLGLGLPLVQRLAAANGGELALESTPGRGTRASVVFPKDRVIPV